MLMHIVLFTFKPPWNWTSSEAIEAEKITLAHPQYIDEIKGWTCGRNTTNRDIAADFVVIGLFKNRTDLNNYINHLNHKTGVERWKVIADWTIIDIELSNNSTPNSGLLSVLNTLNA